MIAACYRRLGEGRSVSESLAGARAEHMRAGAPAAAWAGVVVVGDGDLSFPRKGAATLPFVLVGAGALAIVLALAWRRRASRRRHGTVE